MISITGELILAEEDIPSLDYSLLPSASPSPGPVHPSAPTTLPPTLPLAHAVQPPGLSHTQLVLPAPGQLGRRRQRGCFGLSLP